MNSLYIQYRSRIQILALSVSSFSMILLFKIFFIQIINGEKYQSVAEKKTIVYKKTIGKRGTIYDRNGVELAQTIKKYDFWVNTNKSFDENKIINIFSKTFKEPQAYFSNKLSYKNNYVSIKRNVPSPIAQPIIDEIKSIKGLYVDTAKRRYYPQSNLASQVLGYVDSDNKGQFGIEHQFDENLKGSISRVAYNRSASGKLTKELTIKQPTINDGDDIKLTLDIKLQSILENELKKSTIKTSAKSANGIIMNPFTGEILAMATYPSFNPNEYEKFPMENYKNRTISDAYEPGSTYKIINLATALESNIISVLDTFYCENGKYELPRGKIVHDHEPHENMSVEDIFIQSSNIGIMKIAEILGDKILYNSSRRFGFGMKTGIKLPNETTGKLRMLKDWSGISGRMISIGQEISSSTLQVAMAYSTIANGGFMIKPYIVKTIGKSNLDNDYPKVLRKIISEDTCNKVLSMMEKVVTSGTGTNAYIPGFRIGGKTGTAEKFIDGSYSKRDFISSFASIFPVDNPKYVCVVSIDSPKYGYHWGNETAAPVINGIFSRIINDIEKPTLYTNLNQTLIKKPTSSYENVTKKINVNVPTLKTKKSINLKESKQIPNFIGKTLKES